MGERRKPILVVEDDSTTLDLMLEVLSAEGYEVLGARSGQRALQLVVERSVQPDLLLLDYHLVGGMNGLDLYDQLQSYRGNEIVRAIMISATLPEQEELRRRAIVGLPKPWDIEALLQVINQAWAPVVPCEKERIWGSHCPQ